MIPMQEADSAATSVSVSVRMTLGSWSFNPIVMVGLCNLCFWGARWGAEWYLYRNGFFDELFEIRSSRQVWRTLARARECGEQAIERTAFILSAVIAVSFFLALSTIVLFGLALFGVIG